MDLAQITEQNSLETLKTKEVKVKEKVDEKAKHKKPNVDHNQGKS